ncbi:MAG: glutamate synthase subunit beta [Victivallaceae bacterium]|nr:glutamate synthase subunit beta [Victivallaceae bacterium]
MKNRDFLDIPRVDASYRPAAERLRDYAEVEVHPGRDVLAVQAGRCMNCGIPFCHAMGCPLKNAIPEINRAVAENRMADAWALLSSTSNFPEFTSRVCPALCEGACTNGLNLEAVTIRQLEYLTVEQAFADGLVQPRPPRFRTGKTVAVIGGGPAGLAAADILNKRGHLVTVYEANGKAGGLLRYGIPDFKLAKQVIDRRLAIMIEEGVEFVCSTRIGDDISMAYLRRHYDAVVVAVGTPVARDLAVPGRELSGIYPALEFLTRQNRIDSGEGFSGEPISAAGKQVVVIGGGDTGSDCVGTANRQGAVKVTQIEIMPKPPEVRSASTPWPQWPYLLRTSSSHKEGCVRDWCVATKSFDGRDGKVTGLRAVRVNWEFSPDGKPLKFTEIPGSEYTIEADLVLLALGFVGFSLEQAENKFNLKLNGRHWFETDGHSAASFPGVFVAGDAGTGPSLVVRAIASGRDAAAAADAYLGKDGRP